MKPFQFLILLIFSLSMGCKDGAFKNQVEVGGSNKAPSTVAVFELQRFRSKFKYIGLSEFQVDTFGWEKHPSIYNILDTSDFKFIFQDNDDHFQNEPGRYFFHSWQPNDRKNIEFTILEHDESNWCSTIWYMIFDSIGRFKDRFGVASSCGDGQWIFNADGKFSKPTLYELETVESNVDDTIETIESCLRRYQIQISGKVLEKSVFCESHLRPYKDE